MIAPAMRVALVEAADFPELLPLMRGYCDFYGVAPSDDALLAMSRALLDDPDREGVQLLVRDGEGRAVGFATVFWTWSTLRAARIGVMNDLFVAADARGQGAAEALIAACVERCHARGAVRLGWQTALDNERAQALYDRVGGERSQWLDYGLEVTP